MITPDRDERLRAAAFRRQFNLTVVLENVHDIHNIGAVLRTCDAVGIKEVFILYTESNLTIDRLADTNKSSSGSRKWITIHYYRDVQKCFEHLRKDYDRIMGTHLSEDAVSLYEMDLTESIALVFGNEHLGISAESLALCDGNFTIPQQGLVQSLNISVACAVTLYEGLRQRSEKGFYTENPTAKLEQKEKLHQEYIKIHEARIMNRINKK